MNYSVVMNTLSAKIGRRCPLQLATGVAPHPPTGTPDAIVVAYGERDCDSRASVLPLRVVLDLLRPV